MRGGHGLHGADHAVRFRGGVAPVGDALVALELQRRQLLLVLRHLLRQEIARVADGLGAAALEDLLEVADAPVLRCYGCLIGRMAFRALEICRRPV